MTRTQGPYAGVEFSFLALALFYLAVSGSIAYGLRGVFDQVKVLCVVVGPPAMLALYVAGRVAWDSFKSSFHP